MRMLAISLYAATRARMPNADRLKLRGRRRSCSFGVGPTLLSGWLLALCAFSTSAQTNTTVSPAYGTALVTFFSNPFKLLGSSSGHKSASFKGKLFMDRDELAKVHAGHFITISFAPGSYEFTATTWMANGPAGGGHLKLDLVGHHHYYIELRDRESFPLTKMFGIKEVACEEAFRNNAKNKPIDPSDLTSRGKGSFISETAFPICPETD